MFQSAGSLLRVEPSLDGDEDVGDGGVGADDAQPSIALANDHAQLGAIGQKKHFHYQEVALIA